MIHLSTMIEEASAAVTNIKVEQGKVLMQLAQSNTFTPEQIQKIVTALEPVNAAITKAQASFVFEIKE